MEGFSAFSLKEGEWDKGSTTKEKNRGEDKEINKV